MKNSSTIKINFRGGIISPGDLYNILVAATKVNIRHVSFGLRQQLLINVGIENKQTLVDELDLIDIAYEVGDVQYPNIVSSYPAEEIFINNTWLSEGVYKDIFDGIDYQPTLKINVSDSNQSFTPMLTGNINWVAAKEAAHFWHLFIRFPKTNTIYEWNQLVYTNDVARVSKEIEQIIRDHRERFSDNTEAQGETLMKLVHTDRYITKPVEKAVQLPSFNLPYYEGFNKYNNNKYWMGVYRRDELFSVDFLKEVCRLCLETKIGQLCSTPWKSIIIKGIDEKDKHKWSLLLDKYHLNVRHAANELNFQVEDDCIEGLALKNYLVKQLNSEDTRTFGLCIGIKTRNKSEVFSSILVKCKPLLKIFGWELLYVYDILCAHDFNPNARTGFVFSSNNPKFLLSEQLRRSVNAFYQNREGKIAVVEKLLPTKKEVEKKPLLQYVHQCADCLTVYDETVGEPESNIAAGIKFESLPADYCCPLCDGGKESFTKIEKSKLGLQAV
jgi:rubredoxin